LTARRGIASPWRELGGYFPTITSLALRQEVGAVPGYNADGAAEIKYDG